MNPVATIIRRNLLGNRAIVIPSFGTIMVRRTAASMVDGGARIATPYLEVVVLDEMEDQPSIIQYIEAELNVDQIEATLQYNHWLDSAVQGDYLVVDGVGVFGIADRGGIEIIPEFASLLNPMPQERVVVGTAPQHRPSQRRTTKGNYGFMMFFAIAVTLGAIAYLIYYFSDELSKFIE